MHMQPYGKPKITSGIIRKNVPIGKLGARAGDENYVIATKAPGCYCSNSRSDLHCSLTGLKEIVRGWIYRRT